MHQSLLGTYSHQSVNVDCTECLSCVMEWLWTKMRARTQSQVELAVIPPIIIYIQYINIYESLGKGCFKSSLIQINFSGRGICSVCLKYQYTFEKYQKNKGHLITTSSLSITCIYPHIQRFTCLLAPICPSLSGALCFLL